MEWISNSKIMIVGLGLMGGSYAKALKRIGYYITAIDKNEESIQYALENDIIDKGSSKIEPELIGEADVLIFALYPEVFIKWIEDNQKYFKAGARLTDVTGVKGNVVYKVQEILRPDVEYIAAHPMAGREVYGVKNSDDSMFHNANYIVVPTPKNTPEAIEWCKGLGKILGARRISVLSPEEHDKMIGFVSQLTHCIAVALMTSSDDRHLVDYTGDSFRDLTRIARINEKMWSELFLMNKDELLNQMDNFLKEFSELRDMLMNEDREGMMSKMKISTERRSWFDV